MDIVCSLDGADHADRIEEWRQVLAASVGQHVIAGGRRISFPADPTVVGRLADLVVREHACCPFLSFTLHVEAGHVDLDVRAPDDARVMVDALLEPVVGS